MADMLLVHGGWHGPWCWRDFAARLTQRGHNVQLARLRGHDGAPGRIWHRVRHYVEDVEQAVARFPQPPILVGHSLGGLIVQKYLEAHTAPASVLMASVPPGGTLRICWRLLRRYPLPFLKANLLLSLRPLVTDVERVRELFFTPERPLSLAAECMARLQDESYLAFLDTIFFEHARPDRVRSSPVLVLGAERDSIVSTREVEITAQAYRTRAEMVPGIGHDMMLDQGWEGVADRIDRWALEL
jgi:alpha-beta hydrolase superfamily lysophospholipase